MKYSLIRPQEKIYKKKKEYFFLFGMYIYICEGLLRTMQNALVPRLIEAMKKQQDAKVRLFD